MAHYKLNIAYDGTNFHGSQVQLNQRTVQGEFEGTLRKLGWNENSVLMAGRTDAGVHANDQVLTFHLDWNHSISNLHAALNSLLPSDISVRAISQIENEFHPRFDAISRTYKYYLLFDEYPNPTKERFTWRLKSSLDLEFMKTVSKLLIGEHNFGGFGKAVNKNGTTIREVQHIDFTYTPEGMVISITANAFLYHMVRRITNQLVKIGKRELSIDQFMKYIDEPDEHQSKGLAPAKGLFLHKVCYDKRESE